MKALLRLFAATAMLAVANGPAVPISAPVGQVLKATQTVRASGNAGARVLSRNSDIYFLDRISTNATGVGEFEFADGTKLAVGPSASLVVDAYILKNNSSFKKLGLSAAKGTFRWISGRSSSSAYQIRTPYGTMGIRGTAFDVTVRNGRVYVALINGSAKFCAGSSCQTLNRSCDYIVADGRKLSKPEPISTRSQNAPRRRKFFPISPIPIASPPGFVSAGAIASEDSLLSARTMCPNLLAADPEPGAEPDPESPTGKCGGNCGNGKGRGGGNGNNDEGQGND